MISFLSKFHQNEISFYQPNLGRMHFASRSPLSSERLNLISSSFSYDIYKLYDKITSLTQKLESDFTIMTDGDSVIYNITLSGDATPSSITIKSIHSLVEKMEGFSNRLEILEKGLG